MKGVSDMGLVKFGGGITQISGNIAGNVYARNRYGNYVRPRTIPTNPRTAYQTAVREAIAMLSERWSSTLTAAQRTAWNLYASSVVVLNRLGESMYLSGYNHYIRSNVILSQIAATLVDAGPTIFEIPEQDPSFAISASEATQQISVTFDNTKAWANEDDAYLVKYQGSPQNAQRNFFNGPWRLMGHVDGDSVTPPSSPDAEAVAFAIAEGQHLWVYARIIRADGRLSERFRADCFCAA
jgi:hypothetical protein